MVEHRVKWNQGDGYIIATSKGEGDGPIALTTDGPNEGLDREQIITIETIKGNNIESAEVYVSQEGMRERFYAADGLFITSEGETFNVIKEKYYGE